MFGSSVCWKRPFSGSATGYGKSIIFHLLPALLLEKNRRSTSLLQVPPPVVVVISPLNSLIHDQIRRINTVRNRAAVLSFTRPMEADQAVEHAVLDQTNVDELRLKNGGYELVFLDQLLFDFDAFAGIDCLHDPL